MQAPRVAFFVLPRGIDLGLRTRMEFAEAAQADGADPVMSRIGHPARRQTLVARRAGHDYVFDIRPQGEGETVFPDG